MREEKVFFEDEEMLIDFLSSSGDVEFTDETKAMLSACLKTFKKRLYLTARHMIEIGDNAGVIWHRVPGFYDSKEEAVEEIRRRAKKNPGLLSKRLRVILVVVLNYDKTGKSRPKVLDANESEVYERLNSINNPTLEKSRQSFLELWDRYQDED